MDVPVGHPVQDRNPGQPGVRPSRRGDVVPFSGTAQHVQCLADQSGQREIQSGSQRAQGQPSRRQVIGQRQRGGCRPEQDPYLVHAVHQPAGPATSRTGAGAVRLHAGAQKGQQRLFGPGVADTGHDVELLRQDLGVLRRTRSQDRRGALEFPPCQRQIGLRLVPRLVTENLGHRAAQRAHLVGGHRAPDHLADERVPKPETVPVRERTRLHDIQLNKPVDGAFGHAGGKPGDLLHGFGSERGAQQAHHPQYVAIVIVQSGHPQQEPAGERTGNLRGEQVADGGHRGDVATGGDGITAGGDGGGEVVDTVEQVKQVEWNAVAPAAQEVDDLWVRGGDAMADQFLDLSGSQRGDDPVEVVQVAADLLDHRPFEPCW